MKRNCLRPLYVLLATFALLTTTLSTARAQFPELVTNGGFESPVTASVLRYNDTNGYYSNLGWYVEGGAEIVRSAWPAFEGLQSIDLNPYATAPTVTPPGGIAQPIPTVPGETYLISFRMSGNPDQVYSWLSGPTLKTMDVTFGNDVHSYSFDTTGRSSGDMGWVQQQFLATATAATSWLRFTSTNSGYGGIVLDAVSVTQQGTVPVESTSWGRVKALLR